MILIGKQFEKTKVKLKYILILPVPEWLSTKSKITRIPIFEDRDVKVI